MAASTNDVQFRRINVDEYNEDNYVEDDLPAGNDVQGFNESEITALLNQGNKLGALKSSLSSAPINSKNQAMKDKAMQIVLQILLSVKGAEIDEIIKTLDEDSCDTLFKYIYRGFEVPSEGTSAVLLTWFEKVFTAVSYGGIMRVLADKRRV